MSLCGIVVRALACQGSGCPGSVPSRERQGHFLNPVALWSIQPQKGPSNVACWRGKCPNILLRANPTSIVYGGPFQTGLKIGARLARHTCCLAGRLRTVKGWGGQTRTNACRDRMH